MPSTSPSKKPRRCNSRWMSETTWMRLRADASAPSRSAGRAGGNGAAAVLPTVPSGRGVLISMGAGCRLACKNSALTKIAMVAAAAMITPTESSGRRQRTRPSATRTGTSAAPKRASMVPTVERSISDTCSSMTAADAEVRRLGTFPHLVIGMGADGGELGDGFDPGFRRLLRTLAVDRKAYRDTRSDADAAVDFEGAAMQRHETLDDREAETGAVIGPCIGAAGLEERIADAGKILGRDSDAGVLDAQQNHRAVEIDRHGD